MKTNVGSYDAGVRFVVGMMLLWFGAHRENWWGLVGLIPIVTAGFEFCPLYRVFHLDTTFTDQPHDHH